MAGYITWLTPQMPRLPVLLRETFEGTRLRAMSDGEHLRVPEALSHLWLGLHCGLNYAEEIGACSPTNAKDLRVECWDAFLALGRDLGQLVEEERPSRRFLRVLLTLITQNRAILLPKDTAMDNPQAGIDFLGWHDEDVLYLLPEAAFTVVSRFCRDSGEPFVSRPDRIKQDLIKEGISDCDSGRRTGTAWLAGKTRRVLKLKVDMIETLLGEEVPDLTGPHHSHHFRGEERDAL